MLFLPFLMTSNTDLYRAHPNTKKILIQDVEFVMRYNIYQYLFWSSAVLYTSQVLEFVKKAENDIFSLVS